MTIYTEHDGHTEPTATEWLSPNDICSELQIPLQTFYQWRVKGIGPRAYRFGRHLRIDRQDFIEWSQLHLDGFPAVHPSAH